MPIKFFRGKGWHGESRRHSQAAELGWRSRRIRGTTKVKAFRGVPLTDKLRDLYFELEEDALNEANGNERAAKKLLNSPKWVRNEFHDMKLRGVATEQNERDMMTFLFGGKH